MPYLNPNATIPPAKLNQYLLVLQPKDDKSGFLAQAGYNLENWQGLEQDLRGILLNNATLNIAILGAMRYNRKQIDK